MITVIKTGQYSLVETTGDAKKLLILDTKHTYVWVTTQNVDELFVLPTRHYKPQVAHVTGKYRLYEVTQEPALTDVLHMELLVGKGRWQGYLLPTGLPTTQRKRIRIIATEEKITKPSNM